jgi:multidrug resistance efflux pump
MSNAFPRSAQMLMVDRGRATIAGILIASLLFGAWLAWAFLARVVVYAVTDKARLEVDRAVHMVEAPVAGRVVATHMELDRKVTRGAVLVELETVAERLQYAEAQTQLATFAHEIESLAREKIKAEQALREVHQADNLAFDEAQAQYREAQISARVATQEADRAKRLHSRGYLADADLERIQAQMQQRLAVAARLRLAARRLQQEQRTHERDRQVEMERLTRELARLKGEQSTASAAIDRLTHNIARRRILAPVSGRLGKIAALQPGVFVKEGDTLAAVVPEGDVHIVADFFPHDALGRIQAGQSARLRLDSFPWAQYGMLTATVARVASEARDGRVRVELTVSAASTPLITTQHGLTGTLEVEVEKVAPAALVLRAAGQLIAASRKLHAASDIAGEQL